MHKLKNFFKNHPIIANILAILICFIIFINGLLFFIDGFTEHGKYQVVPTIKGLSLDKATIKLEQEGFKWDVSDSIYSDDFGPGVVVDQNPKENSKIKSNRIVYLVINAFSPRVVTMPNVLEMSERQAISLLEGLGLKNVRVETIFSPYKGLVIDCKINGKSIGKGTRVSSSSYITLVVGDGAENTISTDSIIEEDTSIDENLDDGLGVDFM